MDLDPLEEQLRARHALMNDGQLVITLIQRGGVAGVSLMNLCQQFMKVPQQEPPGNKHLNRTKQMATK